MGHDAVWDARGAQRRCVDLLPRRDAGECVRPGGALVTESRRPAVCYRSGRMNHCLGSEQSCIGRRNVANALLPSGRRNPSDAGASQATREQEWADRCRADPMAMNCVETANLAFAMNSSHRLRLAMELSAA